MSVTESYSGIIINQNQIPATGDFYGLDTNWVYQEFFLPENYIRGADADEAAVPDLSGFQLMLQVDEGFADSVTLDYRLQQQYLGSGWVTLSEGTAQGVGAEGDKTWINIFLASPVEIGEANLRSRLRIGFRTTTPGISGVWYSAPNPLTTGFVKAYAANGTTPLTRPGDAAEFSFVFRILGLTVDSGEDFLGNTYRSAVLQTHSRNVTTAAGADPNAFWLSRPNPSEFAVENLYFDVSNDGEPVVIDRVLVDPVTPGVYFHIYYSSEGEAVTDTTDWDSKLWHHVPQTFRMSARETHTLPLPIQARYIKIEFSHLQARYYAPGAFALPVEYNKHPKWVLDYFLARVESNRQFENLFVAPRVTVVYDALDLAYSYYRDDIRQAPDQPTTAEVAAFLADRSDTADRVDPATLSKISLALQPYRIAPALRAKLDTLLGEYVRSSTDARIDYAVEQEPPRADISPEVSTLNRDRVVFEQTFPVMFFYLTCRHAYRRVRAPFSHDRAYFAGVREIAFTRENYLSATDTPAYIETNADLLNVERNDFIE